MKHVAAYRQLKPIYDRYQASKDKEKFLRGYEREIILFEAAARECKRLGAVPLPSTERMQTEMDALTARRGGADRRALASTALFGGDWLRVYK